MAATNASPGVAIDKIPLEVSTVAVRLALSMSLIAKAFPPPKADRVDWVCAMTAAKLSERLRLGGWRISSAIS